MVNTSNETDASSSEIVNQAETSSIVSEDQTPLVENGHDKQLRTVRMKRSQQNMDQRRMNVRNQTLICLKMKIQFYFQ